ncbi:unnamed protein product [Brugia timori]|uniref:G-protein coupled receptors family 1 profile domain-containing protein n=1 Tax=Brugia timori TaxID=42155 RepID=A0A3P7YUT2_9BILA|nr:unnamed protein product [Brugia timori]
MLYGIIGNLLMAIICYSRNNPYSRPFILIISQIITSNFISFIPYVIVLLPGLLLSKKYAYKTWMNFAFCTVRIFSTFATIHFSFVLSLNRFVAVVLPKFNALFESGKLYFLFLFAWLTAFVKDFKIHFNLTNFVEIWALFLSITMLLMYSAIICNIRNRFITVNNETRKTFTIKTEDKTKALRTAKYERSMLIQAAMTCGGLILGSLLIFILPMILIKIFSQKILIPMNIFHCLYFIFYRCILPTAFFLTSEYARRDLYLALKINVVKPILLLTKYDIDAAVEILRDGSLNEENSSYKNFVIVISDKIYCNDKTITIIADWFHSSFIF